MAKKTRVQEEIERYRQSQGAKIESWTAEKRGKQETAVQSAIRTARNSVDTDAWKAQWNQKQAVKKASTGAAADGKVETVIATPDNIWATGRTNAKSAQQRQEEADSRALVRNMQEKSGVSPATKQAEQKADEAGKAPSVLYGQEEEDSGTGRLSMAYWEDKVNSALEEPSEEKSSAKTSGRIQKPDPERYDATQIQQYKEQEISDYKKVFDEQNTLTENRYKAFQEAEAAVKEAEKAYAENTNGVTRKRYNEAYAAYEQAYSALKEASDRAGELADEVNALTAAYQKEYDDATRYAGKDYAGMQNYIWVVEQKLEQAKEGQKTAAGQDLTEHYEQELDRAKKYSYSLASVDELQKEYEWLNALREENQDGFTGQRVTAAFRPNSSTISANTARQEESDRIGGLMRAVQKAMNDREAADARSAYEDYYNGTGEKPDAKLADEQTIAAFRTIIEGRKSAPTAADTTEIVVQENIQRNVEYFPDAAKEVLLQFMEDGDYESAANYYKAYESEATANFANTRYEQVRDWASQNLGTAALATLASGVTGAVTPATAWVDNMFNAINNKIVDATGEGKYQFSDTNSDAYSGARITAALQEGTQTYNATTGKWEGALNLASGAISSAEQNVIQFALFGSASLPIMAASAAGQSTYQNLKSGATEEQAAVTGTVSGLIEYMTEKLPLEHLLDKIHTIQGGGVVTVGQIAKMVREQGLEEASEEVIGNIADNLFDMAYNGENSEYRQYSAQLQREGMSKAEADQAAFGKFFIGDSMEAAAAAYLSTFLLVGGNVVSVNLQASQIGKDMKTGPLYEGTDGQTQYTQKEIETLKRAQGLSEEYAAGQYAAEKLKGQVLKGQQLSNRLLGFAAIANDQAIADASNYIEQGLSMGKDTQSFALAAAIAEEYQDGVSIPSSSLIDTLKNQIEADRLNRAAQEANAGKSAEEKTTLSQYQTFLVKNGVGLKDAQNRTEVLNKLIQGQSVSDRELRSIRMSAKLTKQILQEVAGVEIPAGVTNEKDLMAYYRSAHESFQQKIKAEAEARTAQDAETVAARMAEQAKAVQGIMQEERTAAKSNVDERLQYFFEHGRTQTETQQEATQAEAMQQATPDTTNAEQVTHGQQTAAESVASAKPGLVWDDYVQSSVDATTAEKIDTMAKALGVTVKFADEVAGGEANAQISGTEILIEKNNQNPLMFLLGHELTHRLQDLSPEQYQNFKAAIMDEIRGQAQAIADLYASHGKSITMEAALDEAAADYAGRMIDDGRVLDEFIEKHRDDRTLLQKIVDALRSLIQKLTGAERRKAETAEGKLLAALDAASEQAKRLQQETNDATMGEARTSAKGKYWYPKLTQNEWTLLNRRMEQEIGDTAHTLDAETKWVYAEEKGVRVFALYGVGDGEDATPLYAVGGRKAAAQNLKLQNYLEGKKNGVYRGTEILDRWITDSRSKRGNGSGYLHDAGHGRTDVGNVRVSGESSRRTGKGTSGTGTENRGRGTRFSLKSPVEETKDLLALHNVGEKDLLAALELGGLPMPSIAVVKAADGHSKYGPVSLVFDKATIDPQTDSRNKVYGGDAWTPTAPKVDYRVNSKKAAEFEHEIHKLAGDISVAGGIFRNSSALRSMGIDDTSGMTVAEIAEKLANTDTVRAAYLAEQGETLEAVKNDKVWDKFGNDTLKKVIDRLGVQRLAEMEAALETGESTESAFGEDAALIRNILRDYYREKNEPMLRRMAVRRHWDAAEIAEQREAKLDRSMENVTNFTLEDIVRHAWEMYEDGGATKGEIDRMATSDALRAAVNDRDVESWVSEKLDGLLGEAGIYNGKDPYTPSGNSRSFSQLHYAYTLENIVKAMSEGQKERGVNAWGATAKTLQATATPEYYSVQDIKADSGRLRNAEGTEYLAKLAAIDEQIDDVISRIKNETAAHSDNPFLESDIIGGILVDAANGAKTTDAIVRAFSGEGYQISKSVAQDIQTIYRAVAELPTGYFEAKPRRAVGFDEVLAAVVPDDSSQKLRDALVGAGVNVLTYESGNETDRLAKVNSVENARFSLKNTENENRNGGYTARTNEERNDEYGHGYRQERGQNAQRYGRDSGRIGTGRSHDPVEKAKRIGWAGIDEATRQRVREAFERNFNNNVKDEAFLFYDYLERKYGSFDAAMGAFAEQLYNSMWDGDVIFENRWGGAFENVDALLTDIEDAAGYSNERYHPKYSVDVDVTESRKFKDWFGDWQNHPERASKVVNADGTPRVVYHGTGAQFSVFDAGRVGQNFANRGGDLGFYFTPYQEDAAGYAKEASGNRGDGEVMGVYLDLKNPLIVEDDGWGSAIGQADSRHNDLARWAKEGGHDGIIVKSTDIDMGDGDVDTVYIAFSPNQIKSATDNVGMFDRSNPDIRYSLKDVNGKSVVWIDNNPLSNKELQNHNAVANYIAQHIGEVYTIIESGQKVYLGEDLPGEYTQSKYTSYLKRNDSQTLKTKNKASSDLGELIETATNRRWEKTRHNATKDAKYGMYRYDSSFAFPVRQADGSTQNVRAYDVELLIRNASDGKKYLYDIVGIKENTTDALDLLERERQMRGHTTPAHGSVSADSISNEAENVNPEISGNEQDGRTSAKGAEISREYAELLKENALLREKVDYWKRQTKRTERVTTDQKAVAQEARELIGRYGAEMDTGEIQADLQNLYDFMASGTDGANELTGEEAFRRAKKIADRLVENAVEQNDTLYHDYKDLRDYLRTTKLTISEEESHDIPDWNEFRKENFGRMKLGRGETNVDQVYQELADLWPEFFDESEYTNPVDQLQQIADVANRLYTITERNPFSSYMEQAKTAAANEILDDFFELPQTKKTFADKQAEKLAEAKAKGQQRVADVRAQKNEQLAWLKEQNRLNVEDILNRERSRRKKEISKLKADYKARTEDAKERRSARELRNKITRHTKELSGKLLRPTDAKHIPEVMRANVAWLLETINQEDAYTIKRGTAYRNVLKDGSFGLRQGEHVYGEDRELKGLLTDRTEAFRKLKEQYTKIIQQEDGEVTIDPDLLNGDMEYVISMHDTPISAMNTEQLQAVWNVLRAVEYSVSKVGQILSKAKYTKTQEWAEAMRKGTEHRRERYAPFNTTLLLDYENPLTFFSHYGEAGKAIYRMLRDAQDQQQLMVTEVAEKVQKIVDEKTVKALEHEAHTFTLKSGQSLTLTTAQIMDIYNLMQREQAKAHLTVGGIMQPEVKAGKTKVRRGTEAVQLTEADLKSIAGTLTPEQRKIADGLQKLTAGLLADFGNEASMKAYGYKKFTDAHYWPIRSASESVHSNVEKSGTQARSIKNIGMAKATTPGANNPLDISSVFDTFSDHAADMTDYAAWLCPMEDANHLFNYSVKGADGRVEWTVKSILDRYGGRGAQRYWQKLMEDIQNGIKTKDYSPVTNLASKAISGFKGAAVGGNIRVVIQQPTAFFRAAAVMNPLDMAKGLVKGATKGSGWKKALQYSPIAQRKDNGSFDISAPYSMHQTLFDGRSALAKTNDALSAPAGVADAVTWGKIWNGCEHTVARNYENLTPGSKAFYEQVAKQFAEVIDQTQVVDGVLQRSNIMRAKSEIARQATSFKGEPLMSLNLLIRSFQEARYAKDGKDRARATGRLARAGFALAVTAGINALAQSLIDAIRDDDPDKKYWQRFMSAFTGVEGDETSGWEKVWHIYAGNLADGLILVDDAPFISDIVSMIQGYEVARQDTEVINDIINAGETFIKSMDGTGQKTRAYAIKQLFGATAKLFAVPVNNLTRDVWGVARSFAVERDNLPLQYEMDKAIYNIDNDGNAGRFSDLMYKALRRGEEDTFEHIKTDLMEHMGKTEEEIKSALKSRVREDYINRKFTSEEAAAFLVEHGLEDDEFEAFWTIQRWDNRKNEGWTKTKELGDTVFNGGVSPTGMTMDEVVDFYVEHGMEKSDVQSAITGFIHDAFDAGEVDVEMAQDLLYQYQAYDEDEESYKDEDDVYWTVKEWVEQYNGNEDWRKYGELGDAVTAGKDIENLLKQYEAHGADAEDQITSELHEAWKDGKLSDKDAVRRLIQYEKAEEELDAEYTVYTWKVGGELSTVYKNGEIKKKDAIAALLKYEKADDQLEAEYKIFEWELGMELSTAYKKGKVTEKEATAALLKYEKAKDEHEAYWTIHKWESGEDKYDQFVSAVESGTNLSETISYYKDHGVTEKTLKSQITTHFKPLYVEASVHERQYMKEYLLDAFEALGKPRWKASNDIDDWLED